MGDRSRNYSAWKVANPQDVQDFNNNARNLDDGAEWESG